MRRRQILLLLLAVALALVMQTSAAAQPAPTTQITLDQLSQQTRALYRQVQSGIFRVEMPQPKWVSAYAMAAIERWQKKLSPEVREQLTAQTPVLAAAPDGPLDASMHLSVDPATGPEKQDYVLVPPPANRDVERDPIFGGRIPLDAKPIPGFAPNNIGLLLDEEGHVLVPLYVERETVGDRRVRLAAPGGTPVEARFVGSDRQTNLTLLRLEKPGGKSVKLGASRPDLGSLVLCVSPSDGSARLGLWTDGAQDNGFIINTSGEVAGIARYGQFLTGSSCQLIARQLIDFGAVKRATLGVLITEVRQEEGHPAVVQGSRSAMRIDQVISGSAADRAGLRSGDLVISVAGLAVRDLPSFAAAIAARDGNTELLVVRAGKPLKLIVDLQQQK